MEPRFVELGEMKLIGLPFYGNPEGGKFGDVWHRLMQQVLPTQGRVNEKVAYGVEFYGPEWMTANQWMYFPCFEVNNLENMPGLLFAKTLPAARYAVFTSKGGLATLGDTFKYVYSEWMPASGYELAYPYDFEYYGEAFQSGQPGAEVDIYLPIRTK
jgi:AraC family transcriptional regulator